MSDIPPPLITEILSRLPAKSLLRFRTVAKSWKSLIDTSYFANLHLNNALQNPSHYSVILKTRFSLNSFCDPSLLYSVDFPSLNHATRIDWPLDSDCDATSSHLLGSCNGLLCVDGYFRLETFLFNPTTRMFRAVPVLAISDYAKICSVFIYGFGYDCVNGDYKLVCILQPASEDDKIIVTELRVFSLRGNCWSEDLGFPAEYYIKYCSDEGSLDYSMCNGVHVKGCLHWVVHRKPVSDGCKMIVAFDLATEERRVVPWPEISYECLSDEVKLGLLEGCLMVQFINHDVGTEVWIMKEYNVVESWTRLFSIPKRESLGSLAALKYIAHVERNGVQEVLIENEFGKLVRVYLERGRAKGRTKLVVQGIESSSFESVLVVESLVSLEVRGEEEEVAEL